MKHTKLKIISLGGIEAFAGAMLTFFFPLFFKEQLGLSGAQIGLLYALGSATGFLTILPIGFINDKLHCRRLVISGLVLSFVSYLILPYVTSFQGVVAAFMGLSLGFTLFVISIESLLHKVRESENRGSYYGAYNAIRSLGVAMGMVAGGIILTQLNFETVFNINAVIYGAMIFLALFLPPTNLGKVQFAEYKKDILNSNVLIFLFILFMFALHFGAENTSYGLFLQENLHLSKFHMGLYMAGELIAIVLTSIFLGKAVDKKKISILTTFIVGIALSGLTHIFMTIPIVWLSFAIRLIHGVGDGAMFVFIFIGISKFFEKERVGGNKGIVDFIIKVGIIVGALIFGPLGEMSGYHLPLIYSGILEVLGLLIFLAFLRKRFGFSV
jgi:MFS family permease